MTRVSKSAFNVREKLTELGRRFGIKGSELVAAETVQDARNLVSAGRKNMVINGAMQIHQRGVSTTTLDGGFGADRFVSSASGLDQYVFSMGQSNTSPPGFSNSLRIEGTTLEVDVTSGEYLRLTHRIEAQNLQYLGFGSREAKDITVSFWVRSSLVGDYAFHIWQADTNDIVNAKYSIEAADTWQHVSFTFSGNTINAINNDNGIGLVLNWVIDAGSNLTASSGLTSKWVTYNGTSHFAAGHTANFCGANNNFYLTGVQLEVGRNATDFEYRSYGEELALCQRYYQITNTATTFSNPTLGETAFTGWQYASNAGSFRIRLPVQMRTSPTTSAIGSPRTPTSPGGPPGSSSGTLGAFGNGDWMNLSTVTAVESTPLSVRINTTGLSGAAKDAYGLYFYGTYLTANIILNAEL